MAKGDLVRADCSQFVEAYCAQMIESEMFTELSAGSLAQAFPQYVYADALNAGKWTASQFDNPQWTERFEVQVGMEVVKIPARLRFLTSSLSHNAADDIGLMAYCFQTRSADGFQRQRALRELLADIRPWSAPFVITLIGEYVIEILQDIYAALSPRVLATLAEFIAGNAAFWERTRQRVASYWNAYYRREFSQADYVGFKLISALDAAVRSDSKKVS